MKMWIAFVAITAMATTQMLISDIALAEQNTGDKSSPTPGYLSSSFNLHYTGMYCRECHEKIPEAGGNAFLKFGGDFTKLCKCHYNSPGDYIHPVDIEPSEKKAIIPKDFPLKNGKISCATCHDLYLQCQKSTIKKTSLRGAPFGKRTDFCFKCHNKRDYVMLDAHKQLDDKNKIVQEICLYCHAEMPDEKHASYQEVKLIGSLEVICQRCHAIKGKHSGNFNHLIKPSEKGLARMKEMEKKFDIILPLDENGKMTCITCHNPHQKGVIPAERAGAKGADSKFRHRLPGKLCIECHQM
jgi:hypothetical protein